MPNTTKNKIDKLDRQAFIKFIENLILNSDNYKRDNDSKAYVMALNSAWGTGKSYFLDLLIQDVENNEKISIVKYNAWENDYCDNAFNPLIYDILKSDAVKFDTEKDADVKNVKKILSSIGRIGLTIGKQVLNKKIKADYGVEIDKAVDEAVKSGEEIKRFMFKITENLEQLNDQRESFDELKTSLGTSMNWMQKENKKLVVIIDELDRCKPTFAIQTLEIVKHIFDIENIVFLFAVDIEQLSHSISSVYGNGFDSVGYLCRFFDYIAKMPTPNIKCYIENVLSDISSIKDKRIESYRDETKSCLLVEDISEFFVLLYLDFNLSLRDLDTILKNYMIMLDNFLNQYELSLSHIIYLFFLTLKYKKPMLFNDIFIKKTNTSYDMQYGEIANFKSINVIPVHVAAMQVLRDKTLIELKESAHCTATGKKLGECLHICNADDKRILFRKPNSMLSIPREIVPKTNYGNLLFSPDFKKWPNIKDYTYRDYIHKQLENYNFINLESKGNCNKNFVDG